MPGAPRRVVFGLGSNLGDRESLLRAAADELRQMPGVAAWGVSSTYETVPVGGPPQGRYLNAAIRLTTNEDAESLLHSALRIEAHHGRVRLERNGPRTLDIDLLWIEDEVVDVPSLQVPHPRLYERAFALLPLLDVAPDARDPRTGMRLDTLVAKLDTSGVVLVADPGHLGGSSSPPAAGARLDTPGRKC